jgi:recombination protein RecT
MDLIQIIDKLEPKFKELASHQAVKFANECQFAKQIILSNSYLQGIAKNNPNSLESAVLNVASCGITLNPALKYAYLVPRKGVVCLDVSYMGLVHLATESGGISWVQAQVVKEKDEFSIYGIGEKPSHKYNAFSDRGAVVGVYVVAKTSEGDFLTHTMSIEDVNKIRDRSDAYKGFLNKGTSCPWVTDYEEMVKKTCVKQASKLWPKTGERFKQAIEAENEANGIDFEQEKEEQKEQRLIESQEQKEAYLEEQRLKEQKIDRIKISLGVLTNSMSPQEKGMTMMEICKIRNWEQVKTKKPNELDEIIEEITSKQRKTEPKKEAPKTARDVTFRLDKNYE